VGGTDPFGAITPRPRPAFASREELERVQWERLSRFLRDVVAPNPFYRRLYGRAGVDPATIRSRDEFRRLPLVRKEDLLGDIAEAPPFGTRCTEPPERIVQIVETSGTSGKGQERFPLNAEDHRGVVEMEAVGLAWAGVGPGVIVASCRPVTVRAAGQWYYDAIRTLGGVCLELGTYPTERKVRYLREFQVGVLVASPSYLTRLEIVAREMGYDPASFGVRRLLVAGEAYTAARAEERQRAWGAPLNEQYGSSQRAIAWSCEHGAVAGGRLGVLHTMEHLALYEIVSPETGAEVAPGEAGELLITPFAASSAAPLVRFASGDRVEKVAPGACACGRPFMGIRAGTVGRYDGMLKVRGVNVDPRAVDEIVLRPPILDYRGTVYTDGDGREQIELTLEFAPGAGDAPGRCAQLVEQLRGTFGLRFVVQPNTGPSILAGIRSDGSKRVRWSDRRTATKAS
jgi:phenylacetate-CoA ligase